jgi:hypothetical protein
MSTALIIVLIIIVVAVVAIAAFAVLAARRRALRQRFGPEYDRLVEEQQSRSAAEHELRERERRYSALELREVPVQDRARYAAEWADVQARFVDSPSDAVRAGDELVTRLLADIGYPTGNGERLEMLSVDHAKTLGPYREAHDISERNERGEASTEQLRQALVHYRTLFADLLGTEPVPPATPVDGASPEHAAAPADRTATDSPVANGRTDQTTAAEPSDRADRTAATEAADRIDHAATTEAADRTDHAATTDADVAADRSAADGRSADAESRPDVATGADADRIDGAERPRAAESRNR